MFLSVRRERVPMPGQICRERFHLHVHGATRRARLRVLCRRHHQRRRTVHQRGRRALPTRRQAPQPRHENHSSRYIHQTFSEQQTFEKRTNCINSASHCFPNIATCYSPRPSAKPNAIATPTTTIFTLNTHPAVIDSNGVHRPASSLPPYANQPPPTRTWNVPTGE